MGKMAGLKIDIGAKKDIGKVRQNQEDEVLVFQGRNFAVFGVADGMGGLFGGEVAAKIAVETILNLCQKGKIKTIDDLQKAVLLANQK